MDKMETDTLGHVEAEFKHTMATLHRNRAIEAKIYGQVKHNLEFTYGQIKHDLELMRRDNKIIRTAIAILVILTAILSVTFLGLMIYFLICF